MPIHFINSCVGEGEGGNDVWVLVGRARQGRGWWFEIDQFLYVKIQPNTIDLGMRLLGIL